MSEPSYPPPVDKLLTLGEEQLREVDWLDYASLGISETDIPDLIRMALDEQFIRSDDDMHVYAPIHAWRALGQLRAIAAVEPLLTHFKVAEDLDEWWDWATEELPIVYAMIGAPAIPALSAFLLDNQKDRYTGTYAASSLREIAIAHPELEAECIGIIQNALERFADNDEGMNGFLIADLIELKAANAAPLMQHAFEAGKVDESIAGDWEDVQIQLGLKTERDTPRPHYMMQRILANIENRALFEGLSDLDTNAGINAARAERQHERAAQKKEKNKRKQAKKTRKQNRRK